MALEDEIKARVTKSTKLRLAEIAEQRGGADQGVRISTIVREAVSEYLERRKKEQVGTTSTDAIGKEIEAPSPPNGPKIGFHKKKMVALARNTRPRASHGSAKGGASKPKFHRTYELNHAGSMPPRNSLKAGDLAG